MRRRTLLAVTAGALPGLAGCSVLDGGGSDGPTDAVEALLAAYREENSNEAAKAAKAAMHPGGPLDERLPSGLADRDLTLEDAEVVEETEEVARIAATVAVEADGERWTEPRRFEVRQYEGEWRVWSMTTGPELAVDEFVRAVDEGDVDAARSRLRPDALARGWVTAPVVEHAGLSLESTTVEESGASETTVAATVVESVDGGSASREENVVLARTDELWTLAGLRFGPALPVYRVVTALRENDAAAYEAAMHPDHQQDPPEESDLSLIGVEEVRDISVPDHQGTEATVDADLSLSFFGQVQQTTLRLFVRPHEGEWAFYESETL